MKVETPQLRWHQIINPQSKKDAGANGPILSCSLLTIDATTGVLATAGNTEVNLWRVGFTEDAARVRPTSGHPAADGDGDGDAKKDDGRQRQRPSSSSRILVQPQAKNGNGNDSSSSSNASEPTEHTRIEHIVTLSRGTNEQGINAVKFSPSGLHLVAAGDGGTVVVRSAPSARPSSWSAIDKETDVPMKILFNQSGDVMDVAWSADSRRFAACSLDHTLTVWERHCPAGNGAEGAGEWRNVHRSAKDHTHYIQGVAYDPKGVYLASMGSDRMVKVYSRKQVKDTAVRGEMAKHVAGTSSPAEGGGADGERGKELEERDRKAILQSKVLPELLTNSTFALQTRIKTMKFLSARPAAAGGGAPPAASDDADGTGRGDGDPPQAPSSAPGAPAPARRHMFADELALGSFFRRLAFTADGAFLAVPAALWHGGGDGAAAGGAPGSPTSVAGGEGGPAESSFATYLFARHHFDQPYKVLAGLEKPSVVVRPNPILFQLPPNCDSDRAPLPYRSVLAVLTADTVLLYDTHHDRPLAMARGLHYAGLTDAAWSADGRTLFVTSSDGYVSVLSFGNGEFGDVYVAPGAKVVEGVEAAPEAALEAAPEPPAPSVGSKRAGSSVAAAIHALVPRKKKKRIAPAAVVAADDPDAGGARRVSFAAPAQDGPDRPAPGAPSAPSQPAINILVPKKKKKRIAPVLVDLTTGGGGIAAAERR